MKTYREDLRESCWEALTTWRMLPGVLPDFGWALLALVLAIFGPLLLPFMPLLVWYIRRNDIELGAPPARMHQQARRDEFVQGNSKLPPINMHPDCVFKSAHAFESLRGKPDQTMWGFFHCDSIFESADALMSMHKSKREAYLAMRDFKVQQFQDERESWFQFGRNYGRRRGEHHPNRERSTVKAMHMAPEVVEWDGK